MAKAAVWRSRPREESQNRPWMPYRVSIIKVIRVGIVKIDSQLDQTQPQHRSEKLDVRLRIAANGCDMMYAGNVHSSLTSDILRWGAISRGQATAESVWGLAGGTAWWNRPPPPASS